MIVDHAASWGEKYEGMPQVSNYTEQITELKAANLTGHLLLATGDMDDNVHPFLTMQLADALIKANKKLVVTTQWVEVLYTPIR